jgi:hypothetical protein
VRLNKGVLDVLVAEYVHDMEDVFDVVIFHCAFPVSERVKVDLQQSWIGEFLTDSSLLNKDVVSHTISQRDDSLGLFGKVIQHLINLS